MLRRLRTWMRVVLPFDHLLAAVVVLIALYYAVSFVALSVYDDLGWEDLAAPYMIAIVALAMVYAGFRAAYFNPIENQPYGEWLVNSPWDSSQPLPLGPLNLVWQDVAIVALLTVLFPSGHLSRLIVPMAFLLIYCVGCAYSQSIRSGVYWSGYGVALLAGCFILAMFSPWGRLAIAAAMYPVVFLERQWLLGRFPFAQETHQPLSLAGPTDDPSTTAGWPAPPVERELRNWSINHVHAAPIGATVAWLLYCILYYLPEQPENRAILPVFWYLVVGAMGCRIWIYAYGYAPPISLLGRIATGRLIIPRYDVVFLAPLAATVAAIVFEWAATSYGMRAFTSLPIGCGLLIWLSLALPPRRKDWHFTGHHRLAFRFKAAQVDRSKSKSSNSKSGERSTVALGAQS